MPFAIIETAQPGSWLATWRPAAVYLAGLNTLNTRRAYGTALGQFVELARVELAQVVEWHIAGYKLALVDRGLAPATVRQRLQVLRSFFRWAMDRRLHPGPNPAAGIPLPPRRGGAGRALSGAELGQLLSTCNDRDRALIAVMAFCGLRVGEAVALAEDDLTTDGGRAVLAVRRSKGGRSRIVPAGPALAYLDAYLHRSPRQQGGPLFQALAGGGQPISARHAARIVAGAARAAGLGRLSPHDLRRTYATRGLDAGASLPEMARRLGHGNLTTTALYYRGAM